MTARQLAMFRSMRGPGAAAFLEAPLDERYVIPNDRFTFAVRRRLGHAYAQHAVLPLRPPTCTNTTQAGRVCSAQCDPEGAHLECCAPGGGLLTRHDKLVHAIAMLAKRHFDPRPRTEQIIPQLQSRVGGQVGQARLDVILHNGAARLLVDVTVVSPLAGSDSFISACSRRDGHAARRAAIAKRLKYDSTDLVPFAVETGGRLGSDARALLQLMASGAPDPGEEMAYLYRAVSSVHQDGIARQFQCG